MAEPGEFFPQQFAQGILSLNNSLIQKRAEIRELQNDRFYRRVLDESRQEQDERQSVRGDATQRYGMQLQAAGHQAGLETQKELATQRFAFEQKQLEEAQKNQDAASLAKFGAGQSTFIRSGGPQPPPEALEGPEITDPSTGLKRRAFRFLAFDVPGSGTYYHKTEDLGVQLEYEKHKKDLEKATSENILEQLKGQVEQTKLLDWENGVANWRQQRLGLDEADSIRKHLDVIEKRAIARADFLEAFDPGDKKKMALAARLRVDPTADPEMPEEQRTAIKRLQQKLEAFYQNAAAGTQPAARPRSLTGFDPATIRERVEGAETRINAGAEPSREDLARKGGLRSLDFPIVITRRIRGQDTEFLEAARRPGAQFAPRLPAQARQYYDYSGNRLGYDIFSEDGRLITTVGRTPSTLSSAVIEPKTEIPSQKVQAAREALEQKPGTSAGVSATSELQKKTERVHALADRIRRGEQPDPAEIQAALDDLQRSR